MNYNVKFIIIIIQVTIKYFNVLINYIYIIIINYLFYIMSKNFCFQFRMQRYNFFLNYQIFS